MQPDRIFTVALVIAFLIALGFYQESKPRVVSDIHEMRRL